MYAARIIALTLLVCGAACLFTSCSKKTEKPEGKVLAGHTRTSKPAAQRNKQPAAAAPATTAPGAAPGSSAAAPPSRLVGKDIGEILNSIPCKLESQIGAFAVFPSNPVAGQKCFALTPDTGKEIPPFDIQSNDMIIIIHQSAIIDPNSVKLMKWAGKNGKPCLQSGCGSEIAASRKSFNDPKNPARTFLILTPEKPLDLVSGKGGYHGIAMKNGAAEAAYAPVFN